MDIRNGRKLRSEVGNSVIPHIFVKPHEGLGTVLEDSKAAVNETFWWQMTVSMRGAVLSQENLRGELAHRGFYWKYV